MQAPQMMTSNPAVCTPDTRLPDVARLMVEHDCWEILVVESTDSMQPVGVIPDRTGHYLPCSGRGEESRRNDCQ